jgi:hypothetical protein
VAGLKLVNRSEPEIEWAEYPRIVPGVYLAYCCWAKQYRDPGMKRWTCLIRFDVFDDDMRVLARVPLWLNLGNREKPHAGRRGRYFQEWIRANGGPPSRHDRLSAQVFVRRMVRVEIGDTIGDAPYSVVRRIISWETGAPRAVTQSTSHTVKGGMS